MEQSVNLIPGVHILQLDGSQELDTLTLFLLDRLELGAANDLTKDILKLEALCDDRDGVNRIDASITAIGTYDAGAIKLVYGSCL